MDIDTWLNTILKASPAPTTLGINVFPVLAQPNQSGLYCVYQVFASPQLVTQDGDPEGSRIWRYQFRVFGPSFAGVSSAIVSLRNFLVNYRDWPTRPGIMRVLEINTLDLPVTTGARLFCRMTELEIFENLI